MTFITGLYAMILIFYGAHLILSKKIEKVNNLVSSPIVYFIGFILTFSSFIFENDVLAKQIYFITSILAFSFTIIFLIARLKNTNNGR